MRTIVFFDLPVVKYQDRKRYTQFRKFLLNEGFVMMQESVYSKIVMNPIQNKYLCDRVRKNAPKKGLIQMMIVTEKQFANIEYITGRKQDTIIENSDRLVVL